MAFVSANRMIGRLLLASTLLALLAAPAGAGAGIYRITRDYGGDVETYKARYAKLRARGERIVIDGICNSACTLVLGIVPLNRICVTPRASLGFHQAYYDPSYTFGMKIVSASATEAMLSSYPQTVRNWIKRHGGLTTKMKKVRNGTELWEIIDPCPEEF